MILDIVSGCVEFFLLVKNRADALLASPPERPGTLVAEFPCIIYIKML